MIAFILSPIGRWLIGAAAALAVAVGAYYYVKGRGYAECKADWNAAVQAAIERGEGARRDAERDVDRGVPDGDKFNRD